MVAYSRISLDQLTTRMTERLGNNSTFWIAKEKKWAINEAIRFWAVLTGQWSKRFSIPIVAGQRFYDVPKQLVSIQRIKWNSTILIPSSTAEMDLGFNNWQQSANGTPIVWAPVGLDKIVINPPAASGALFMEGLCLTPALQTGGDLIDIGDEEVNRILDYAHHYETFKEGGLEFDATQALLAGFVEAAVERNQRLAGCSLFKRYLGMAKQDEQRPVRSPEQNVGARG